MIDPARVETPAYVIDLGLLERNAELLNRVQREAECTILLALKGFAAWSTFALLTEYLSGVAASSVAEARLGKEEFGGVVHTYAPAYTERSLAAVLELSDHVVFNSVSQVAQFRDTIQANGGRVRFGIRINPEHSEVRVPLYDPCAKGSRLGATRAQLNGANLAGITGLHFHTLCELGADALERTLAAIEAQFSDLLPALDWVNFGGGHHITREGYDVDLLVRLVRDFRKRWNVDVFLEPGEAVALNTGVLVASVLDITHNDVNIAILDTSATAHMPDVLEMPYRPKITGAGEPDEYAHTVRLGGLTCLAGDVVGDYSFPTPLAVGDKLVFGDMAHYTMVKNTMFNGVELPAIVLYDPANDSYRVARRFGYEDYRNRLS